MESPTDRKLLGKGKNDSPSCSHCKAKSIYTYDACVASYLTVAVLLLFDNPFMWQQLIASPRWLSNPSWGRGKAEFLSLFLPSSQSSSFCDSDEIFPSPPWGWAGQPDKSLGPSASLLLLLLLLPRSSSWVNLQQMTFESFSPVSWKSLSRSGSGGVRGIFCQTLNTTGIKTPTSMRSIF